MSEREINNLDPKINVSNDNLVEHTFKHTTIASLKKKKNTPIVMVLGYTQYVPLHFNNSHQKKKIVFFIMKSLSEFGHCDSLRSKQTLMLENY